MATDCKGVRRGRCSVCSCDGFKRSLSERMIVCDKCKHPPVKHKKMDDRSVDDIACDSVNTDSMDDDVSDDEMTPMRRFLGTRRPPRVADDEEIDLMMDDDDDEIDDDMICSLPSCKSVCFLNANTGEFSRYCEKHKDTSVAVPVQMRQIRHPFPSFNSFGLKPRVVVDTCKLPGCNRPRSVNKDNGELFDCCSRTHGIQLQEMKQQALFESGQIPTAVSSLPPHVKCKNPFCDRPKYLQNGQMFDFCGQSCRNNYQKFQQQKPQKPLNAGPTFHPSKFCLLPGCKLPRYFDNSDGTWKSFCGKQHKGKAESSVLLDLTSDQKYYKKAVTKFINSWNPNKSTPPAANDIVVIFKIFNPKQRNIFETYASGLNPSTTEIYFHGTSIKCDIVKSKVACTNQKCGVCGISRRGFDTSLIGSNIPRFMRFGKGVYLAPNSSKCHDYTQGIVDYRVMLLCEVAPGNKYTVKKDQTGLTAPPQGYDSVHGQSGGSLNYDEIVMFCSESILPKYAIVYKRDGIGKIAK